MLLASQPSGLSMYDDAENALASSSKFSPTSSPAKLAAAAGSLPTQGRTPSSLKRYICTWEGCGKSYTKPAKLKEHELSHTGERPHACSQCSATYRRANHLTAHARTHLSQEQKSFECSHVGCTKRFWTPQHLSRHARSHEVELEYECAQCEAAFAKHHQLRSHTAITHCTPGTKSFRCLHDGCEWSFETSQKLKQHERVHDDSRYMCSHSLHGSDMPTFRTWTDLRAHVKAAHPPTCPYEECRGRTFAKNRNLRDHLQVHREQGDADQKADSQSGSDSDDYPPLTLKRKRSSSCVENDSPKRLRRSVSVESKVWICEIDDCDKRFKTKRALNVHHSTAHLGLRPFACPMPSCAAQYGHKHLLQRHVAAKHAIEVSESEAPAPTAPQSEPPSQLDLLTGMHRLTPAMLAKRPLQCPRDLAVADEVDSDLEHASGQKIRCRHRFARLYDLHRHLRKCHQLVLDEREIRFMLKTRDAGVSITE